MVSYHPAKFGGHHKNCGSGDMMFLICHVISQGNLTQGPCDFTGWSPLRKVPSLPSLAGVGTAVVEMQ